MKSITVHLCAMTLALLSAGAVQAAEQVNTAAFTLTGIEYANTVPLDIGLLSDGNGVTRIAMRSLAGAATTSTAGGDDLVSEDYNFGVALNQGYRITGFSLTGTVDGVLRAASPAADGFYASAGAAANFARADMRAYTGSIGDESIIDERALSWYDQTGPRSFTIDIGNLSLSDDFNLAVGARAYVFARDASWFGGSDFSDLRYAASFASLALRDPVLTIYTASMLTPVPEPETYAMLLAGLAGIGVARRRRA